MDVDPSLAFLDSSRLATLRRTELLDSPREQPYDRFTRLACAALHSPMALLTLVESDRQFFKSSAGLPEPWASARESPLTYSFCRHIVATSRPLMVSDARRHPLVRDNPAIEAMGIVAYAGVPLRTAEGHVIGAFAVADHARHEWAGDDLSLLEEFGAATMHEMHLRSALRSAARQSAQSAPEAQNGTYAPPQFRTVVERSPVGVCIIQDGLFHFANGPLAALLGYAAEDQLAGTSVLDVVAEGDRRTVSEQLSEALRDDAAPLCCDFSARRRDGSSVEVELRSTRAEVADRPALVASVIDVSRRKEEEAALRRSEQRFRALTENSWDVVHTVAPDGSIRYASPSVERLLGFTPEELVGRQSDEFVHPDDAASARAAIREDTGRPGARRRLDMRLRHRDGTWRDVEVVGQIVTDPSGEAIAIVNTHDVTEERRTDRELRRKTANVELMELVAVAANAATSVTSAIEPCLAHICRHNGWCAAHVCLSDGKGNLVSDGTWYLPDPERFHGFRAVTDAKVFGPDVGLPGRVLASGKVEWIPDVTQDPRFARRAEADAAGIKGGIACPMLVGSDVVGVLEFFADRVLEMDESIVEVLGHVGTQLGRVVERVRAHDALLEREARIRSIVEMSHDAFVAMDAKGIVTEWNGQAEATFGWSRAEAIGRPMAEMIIPKRYRTSHRTGMRHFLRTGAYALHSRRFEIEALHRDGHEFPVELSITAIPVGDTYLFTSFLHDITARRQAEERLRQSEERYDLVARATSDVVWDWDIASGVLTWNKAILRTCRYQPEQVGTTMEWWYNHIHPSDRERVVTSTHAVMNGTAELWADEYRFKRGDGTYATVLARGHVVRNGRSEAVRMIGSMVDITERKIEEEAQRFIAQAGALLDTSLDQEVILTSLARLAVPALADFCAIDVLDEAGVPRRAARAHVDPSKEALLRLEADEHSPRDGREDLAVKVMRTRQPVLVRDCGAAALKAMDVGRAQRTALRKLDARSLMIVPLLTREQMLGAITFGVGESGRSYDLMDLLTAEQLAQRAARTIDNGRLYDNAQRAIRARDEVLAVVSHDLRNPLSTIGLSASLLLEDQGERQVDSPRFLEVIRRAADQANRLIKDLLDVSSIEAGHFSIRRARADVPGLVEGAREMLAPIAQEGRIDLVCEVHGEDLVASADETQIQRVFSNLVGNAIKFTPSGGRITLRAEEADGMLQFSVCDTGPGIAPDALPHVFDRFWQAKRGDRRGAGLGLSIVRGIIEAHGGRIWVESSPGSGSTFFFTVPKWDTGEFQTAELSAAASC